MSVRRHIVSLEPEELVDLYRHWTGVEDVPDSDEETLKLNLARLMTDHERVTQRYRDLPPKCREFVAWLLGQEDYAVPASRLDDDAADLPIKPFEVDAVAFALKKRGFLTEARDRSWMHFQEPVFRIPTEVGDVLASLLRGNQRTLESQFSLRAFLRNLPVGETRRRLAAIGAAPDLLADRHGLVTHLSRPESLDRALASLPDAALRDVARKVLDDHGGIGEARQLERLGLRIGDPGKWRRMLEEALLGTILDTELTDVGLKLGPGSLIVFLDLARGEWLPQVEAEVGDEPEPPADLLADIAAVRTFLDHHSVRVTRDGTLYRATLRKMESELLSPGARPVDREQALGFILRFLGDAELVRPDDEGRMRTTKAWKEFEGRGPVEQTDLILTYVMNEMRDAQGAFHLPRLRKIFLAVLREAGPARWVAIRPLTVLARNRYFATLDRQTLADRFQKRFKYAPIPPMATPGALLRELASFASEGLALAGVVSVHKEDDEARAVRLTRLGAAALGLPVAPEGGEDDGALIVTADFEIVLFPEAGGIDLVHEVGRFAKREKADYSLHYRLTERTIQEAVASGLTAEDICATLRRHGRHEIPQNVEHSIRNWGSQVQVLSSRRTLILRAPTPESLDAALKLRELKAIAGERLNPTTLEVSEDPSTPRIAEALRAGGFFLR